MAMFKRLASNIEGKGIRIVFPEANDKRVLGAAVRLKVDHLVEPILLGNVEEVRELAAQNSWAIDNFTIIDPENYDAFDEMVTAFVERRKGKSTVEQAQSLLKDVSYFGTMLVYMGLADGLVSGAIHSTGDTVRPALQIIKTKPGVSRTSGAFIMVPAENDGQKLVFADCAININPNAQELAEIAVEAAHTAKIFDIEPRVAMLSFSTKGSATSAEVDKVAEATKIAQELAPEYQIDGELQFDAAYSEIVADQKAPDSAVAGHATVYVFPDLQSGNIGYKIAQRLGRYQAVGPILQGLNKPISDLSRGCVEEDVYKVAIITANQALNN
ncbi:phosphate acetyltransferase [Aerococcaceae bacterium NML191292]|nr:phosphate acetyltransferase [Aerococcaceae bacterium NML210727]MCW6654735.1 phosphate acetyltransferase [Aerococcaceae bacterium NML201296]MCW6658983.1 phosphate acetyltransferase [Aerococcaceae bacterium NML191292]MCW6662315.1 phosphate acetyltransferase [Aerococcaceae bacterium NML190073]MCW6667400.1 phosphate acetyltransferase [Aerococcaceae bacterium NML190938]MCW6675120.1 phosphate acetyltransferase [Aerococcaceae bacterium NML171108]MCW6676470.1 phosphate acetyltransferase [Aerococca